MKKNTRFAFNAYLQQLARLNDVAVEEAVQQIHCGAVCAADAGRPDPAVRRFPDAD